MEGGDEVRKADVREFMQQESHSARLPSVRHITAAFVCGSSLVPRSPTPPPPHSSPLLLSLVPPPPPLPRSSLLLLFLAPLPPHPRSSPLPPLPRSSPSFPPPSLLSFLFLAPHSRSSPSLLTLASPRYSPPFLAPLLFLAPLHCSSPLLLSLTPPQPHSSSPLPRSSPSLLPRSSPLFLSPLLLCSSSRLLSLVLLPLSGVWLSGDAPRTAIKKHDSNKKKQPVSTRLSLLIQANSHISIVDPLFWETCEVFPDKAVPQNCFTLLC